MVNKSKLSQFIDRLSQFAQFSDFEKGEFIKNIYQGLLIYFIVDGTSFVSNEILEKLKRLAETENPNLNELDITVVAYLKELNESGDGRKVFQIRLSQVINETVEPIKDKLTPEQKKQLFDILQP